jgi:hypothetical protein
MSIPAAVVPLGISAAHLLQDNAYAVECAVQFFVFSAVILLLEEVAGKTFTWFLLSPLTLACLIGGGVHLLSTTAARNKQL